MCIEGGGGLRSQLLLHALVVALPACLPPWPPRSLLLSRSGGFSYLCPPAPCPDCLQLKDVASFEAGQQLQAEELFAVGDLVDVAGTTIGKGFQGG